MGSLFKCLTENSFDQDRYAITLIYSVFSSPSGMACAFNGDKAGLFGKLDTRDGVY